MLPVCGAQSDCVRTGCVVNDFRKTAKWRSIRAQVLARSNLCGLCGSLIDLSLPGSVADGPTVDHIVALHDGGHPFAESNLMACHKRCNSAKENRQRVLRRGNSGRAW